MASSGSTDFCAAGFAFVCTEGGNKAANSRRRTGISLLFDLTIHLLRTATSLVPPPDEILLVGVHEPFAALMNPCALWWLPHLEIGIHRLSAYPKLSGNVGHTDLFCCQILDLVVQLYSLLMKTLTLFALFASSSRYARGLALAALLLPISGSRTGAEIARLEKEALHRLREIFE